VLRRLDIEHFKCFETLRLPLSSLTILSGLNASGKSSAMQPLVLLHQTFREFEFSPRLRLNGNDLRLGSFADVVDKVTGRKSFRIGIVDDGFEVRWTFVGERREMSAQVQAVSVGANEYRNPKALHFLIPPRRVDDASDLTKRIQGLTYLTAERLGPRDVYNLEDPASTASVGSRGEYSASLLYWGGEQRVLEGLAIEGIPPTRQRQVEARMQRFFPGCGIEVQKVPNSSTVTLGLRTSSATDFHSPQNVGFGLTQVLPIVVAVLWAQPGDLLLIENPEVHLHPAGQAEMGMFLSRAAAAGVQLVVETHSDHVLNGVRRAVKSGALDHEDIVIHFFQDRERESQVLSPAMNADGTLDSWPRGFFDQFENDMNYFADWEG
jgi:predicted ATPase